MPFLELALVGLVALVVAGALIILFVGALVFFLPALVAAAVVWFLTGGNQLLTGVAFLVIAALSTLRR